MSGSYMLRLADAVSVQRYKDYLKGLLLSVIISHILLYQVMPNVQVRCILNVMTWVAEVLDPGYHMVGDDILTSIFHELLVCHSTSDSVLKQWTRLVHCIRSATMSLIIH